LNKSESPSQACFLPSLVEIGLVVPYILLCKVLSPWGGAIRDPRDFICITSNRLPPRMLHAKHQCIPASTWFMRRTFLKIYKMFSLFCPLLAPKSGQPFYLNKSESPSSKHVSCHVWLKLVLWFLRRRFFKHFPIYYYVKV